MNERDESLEFEELAVSDRPLAVPDELPILPLRDTVLFPNSFMPLAVARESSVRLIDEAISGGKVIGVFTQRDASVEEPGQARSLHGRHRESDPQDVQAAGRQPSADRPGAHAADARRDHRDTPVSPRARDTGGRVAGRRRSPRDRRAAAKHQDQLPAGRVAVAAALRRPADAGRQHHRARPAVGFHRLEPDHDCHTGKAGSARDAGCAGAHGRAQPDPDQGARSPRARIEDSVAGPVRGRQEPARVLPARADEGDSEGARRGRRPDQGNRGARREDRRRGHARGGEEGSDARARSAGADAGRRRRVHGVAHLSRLAGDAAVAEADRGSHRSARRPRASSTPITPGSRRPRTASSSTWPCAS